MGSVCTALGFANNTDFQPSDYSEASLYATLSAALANGNVVTFACYSGPNLVNDHAYALVSVTVDSSGATEWTLRNPWGFGGTSSEDANGFSSADVRAILANARMGTW